MFIINFVSNELMAMLIMALQALPRSGVRVTYLSYRSSEIKANNRFLKLVITVLRTNCIGKSFANNNTIN